MCSYGETATGVGAIDGKHVVVQAPPHSGSTYYNYKGCHTVVLLAVADANSCFIMVDIGSEGRQTDGGIFRNSIIGQSFQRNLFDLPPPKPIAVNEPAVPFTLIEDEAFALTEYMLRPYPRSRKLNRKKKVFNYRLSRARRMVESAFGILASRWRIYRKPIIASLSTVNKIVQATACLHNFIMKFEKEHEFVGKKYSTSTQEDMLTLVTATTGISDLTRTGSNTYAQRAGQIRETYADFFCTTGAVQWQWEKALLNDF